MDIGQDIFYSFQVLDKVQGSLLSSVGVEKYHWVCVCMYVCVWLSGCLPAYFFVSLSVYLPSS